MKSLLFIVFLFITLNLFSQRSVYAPARKVKEFRAVDSGKKILIKKIQTQEKSSLIFTNMTIYVIEDVYIHPKGQIILINSKIYYRGKSNVTDPDIRKWLQIKKIL